MNSDVSSPACKYKRILLKLSGEALVGDGEFGISPDALERICAEVKEIKDLGTEIAIVLGGGNIFRGLNLVERGIERVTADKMGMLATVINSLAMMDALENIGIYTRVMSAVKIEDFAEQYINRRAKRHMEKGRLVIFSAGTGNPYFTTDTAAALRAMEINAELMIKATNVDGVYTTDPKKDENATFIPSLSYMEVLTKELKVIDSTAISLLKDSKIPVRVIDLHKPGNLKKVIFGEEVGTVIS
ncbi:MAG: UMP kinase [Candidatus Zixiibacteriota bacterium]|nr:MAG: UMP kinase [candidate division Zixibacteria bacterium]